MQHSNLPQPILMKKITLLFLFLLPFIGLAQAPAERIQAYLDANHTKMGLTSSDVSDWFIESTANSTSTKIDNYYVKQRHNGTEIYNAITNFSIKNGEVINVGDRFVGNVAQRTNATNPALSASQAAYKAFQHLGMAPFTVQVLESTTPKNLTLSNGALSEEPIKAELVYQMKDDALRLAWDLEFYSQNQKNFWSIRIDAIDGNILEVNDRVISCTFDNGLGNHSGHDHSNAFTKDFYKQQTALEVQSGSYRVIPFNIESPNHGPFQLITSPHNPNASPFGWHDVNGAAGAEFTITRGNNVFAMEDANGDNGNGASPDGTAALNFDFPYGGTSVVAGTYINAATTNLFYMNNMMHDVWFNYGFNESNGAFQQKNYTGVANTFLGDAVQADSQDGSTMATPNLNNANFFTPVDGNRPRMQMYLWNVGPQSFFVTAPSALAGGYQSVTNGFTEGHVDIPVSPNFLETEVVLYLDEGATTTLACLPPSNAAAMNGKIAIIRRGDCEFVAKVKRAQDAGAVAVIMVDNIPNQLVNMGGADATINIPAVFITMGLGEAIIAQLQSGPVTVKLMSPGGSFVNSDGDFDNGIIAHEYGHGISTRLTGGPSAAGCLQNAEQAGEGWSDWFSLMMQLKAGDVGTTAKGIASFASNQLINGGGIRNFPYSTDMAVNPLTFVDSNDADSPHNRGEFMATVLWDLTWKYIEKYGFDSNVLTGTGGNNKAMRLVLDALKLQPCSPSFIDFRTALFNAEAATTSGEDYCMIAEVFRRRGMGLNASSGSASNALDQVENFTAFPPGANCSLGLNYFNTEDALKIYPNPSNGLFTVRVNQYSGNLQLQVVDINGRVVFSSKDDNFNIERTIDLSHLQSGMYLLKVSGTDLNYTKKLIKN